jgi:hypothetical protein
MRKADRVIMLDNEIEAQRLGAILEEEGIAHLIVSYHDTVYDGLFQTQMGWGHVEAAAEDAPRIRELAAALRESTGS